MAVRAETAEATAVAPRRLVGVRRALAPIAEAFRERAKKLNPRIEEEEEETAEPPKAGALRGP